MDYYNTLLELVHVNVGSPIANLLSLEKEQSLYVSHGIIFIVVVFILLQVVTMLIPSSTYSPSAPSSSKKFANNQTTNAKKTTKRGKKQQLLICGATNSGKTALFYHIVTKEVRTTVSSTEPNETNNAMEVKIPASAIAAQESISKKINIIDVPGHYHFRDRL
jgi:ribosome biogenesis GTPase A